jgi:hypothetical protein
MLTTKQAAMSIFLQSGSLIFLLATLLFSGVQSSTAQEKKENRIAVKSYFNANKPFDNLTGVNSVHLSISICKTGKKGSFTEYEISEFSYTSDRTAFINPLVVQSTIRRKQNLRLRFEFAKPLFRKERTFMPYAGLSVSPYLLRNVNIPDPMPPVRTAFQQCGLVLSFVPRVQWNLSRKCFIDLNTPFAILNGFIGRYVVRNPAYTPDQQTMGFSDVLSTHELSIRLGAGIRLL